MEHGFLKMGLALYEELWYIRNG